MKKERSERILSISSIAFTAAMLTASLASIAYSLQGGRATAPGTNPGECIAFVVLTLLLVYGNFVYQLARAGYYSRRARHQRASLHELEQIYERAASPLAILIPSYKEEPRILRQTVISAALVEHPERRVVVLIDDPPTGSPAELAALEATRGMIDELHIRFAAPARRLSRALWGFLARSQSGALDTVTEARRIAALYVDIADWLEALAADSIAEKNLAFAHADCLFIEKILRAPASAHRERARRICADRHDAPSLEREYRRLAALLDVEIASFERKQYANLSHAPNKAMNLNAYIGLIGKSFREVTTTGLPLLEECERKNSDLTVPAADYLLTVDADSLLLCDYALRLVDIMERDARIAVAQTPYSAFPGAPSPLERVAGATTDIQYMIHQGFTSFGATYWVGANALLRYPALQDIRQDVEERGHRVPVFIQDRTVIEDTGSTIDLIGRGWILHNYPERLAYSATPTDFGSLIIQRRRWSNGGLIILPDLLRMCVGVGGSRRPGIGEAMMRIYYLVSPAAANLSLLALLVYPFDLALAGIWLPLSAAPYYFLYGRDLVRNGYRLSDLARVCALNLLLVPVNLAGVLASLRQACTGKKSPFARTPKIAGRTATPPIFILFQAGAVLYLTVALVFDLAKGRYAHAGFAALNTGFFAYGFAAFIGCQEACIDLAAAILGRWPAATAWLPAFARTPQPAPSATPIFAPSAVSHSGDEPISATNDLDRGAKSGRTRARG
jgi:cellulose synthase/poly-beta-1,6-N-acetylglucosamine synthase-like glycosyltransferase